MKNKTLAYLGLGAIFLLLVGTFAMGTMNGKASQNKNSISNLSPNSNSEDLIKYRSEDIPEECRLPSYNDDVNSWKEHLSHHEKTHYCLDYYK